MTNSLREPRRPAIWLRSSLMLTLLLLSATARAQGPRLDPWRGQPEPARLKAPEQTSASLLLRAYQRSKGANSVAEYTSIIQTCQRSLQGRQAEITTRYARRLMAWAYNRRGELVAAAGEEKKALRDFEAAVLNDPKAWRAIHNRGVSHFMMGDRDKALRDFTRTIRLEPRFPTAYFNRGELRFAQGDMPGALGDYNRVIALGSNDPAVLSGRANAYLRLGQYTAAIKDLDRVIRARPNDARAYVRRGDALVKLSQYQQAAENFEKAIQIGPTLRQGFESAAWLMATCPDQRFRDAKLGVETARKAVQLAGATDHKNLNVLAAAYANSGEFDKANVILAKAIEDAPQDRVTEYQKRLRLYQQGRPYREPGRLPAAKTAADFGTRR